MPTAIITDINLGTESGISLAQKARSIFPSLPIFIISGNDYKDLDSSTEDQIKKLGISKYTKKPFHLDTYIQLVQEQLFAHYQTI
jgi:DNA-binding NtrC family response regulator